MRKVWVIYLVLIAVIGGYFISASRLKIIILTPGLASEHLETDCAVLRAEFRELLAKNSKLGVESCKMPNGDACLSPFEVAVDTNAVRRYRLQCDTIK